MALLTMDSSVIDDLDLVILDELRSEGRQTWTELGARIGLSATATADRVRRLESTGVLRGYTAEIDRFANILINPNGSREE